MPLTTNYTFFGNGNWSIDGTNGSSNVGETIQAEVPTGSEIEAAFLYATTYANNTDPSVTLSSGLDSVMLDNADFTALDLIGGFLQAHRSDVTDFVDDVIGGGSATPFEFGVDDIGPNVDGYALVVVYSNPAEAERTITLLDGGSEFGGDDFTVTLAEPIDNSVPGFELLMSLGIGFSFQPGGQVSHVDVNGRSLTTSAGGQDEVNQDSIIGGGNGSLITIGGLGDDPLNPADPSSPLGFASSIRSDDELYNLALGNDTDSSPFVANGDTSIFVETNNPSNDDNIFFAGFNLTAEAIVDSEGNDAPIAVDDIDDEDEDDLCVNEGDVLNLDPLVNDSDPDGDTLTITKLNGQAATVGVAIALASGATVTLQADGTVDYDPNGAFDSLNNGESDFDSFSYEISDGEKTASADVTVEVKGVSEDDTMMGDDDTMNGDDDTMMGDDDTMNGDDDDDDDDDDDVSVKNLIEGDELDNVLFGTTDDDNIFGLEGDDTLWGNEGDDCIFGSLGNDKLAGWDGNDTIFGGAGSDTMFGDEGNDKLLGDAGDDTITGWNGNDTLWGGTGNDFLLGDAGDDKVAGWDGNDFLQGGAGNDSLFGDEGDDTLAYVAGLNGGDSDVYEGDAGFDTLRLNLTLAESMDAGIVADIAAFETAILGGNGSYFQFSSFDLQAKEFEAVEVVITDLP